jgi:ankyrin repeat protein
VKDGALLAHDRALVNEVDEYGNTPLHLAAWNSSKKVP